MTHSVFLVEKGSDEDYFLVGIYSTREKADRVCAFVNKDETSEPAEVIERPLDEAFDDIEEGKKPYNVTFFPETTKIERHDSGTSYLAVKQDEGYYSTDNRQFNVTVWAIDHSKALKVAQEKKDKAEPWAIEA